MVEHVLPKDRTRVRFPLPAHMQIEIFIIVCYFVWIAYWIWSARNLTHSAKTKKSQSWFLRILAILIVVGFVFLFNEGYTGPALYARNTLIEALSGIITILGLIIGILGRRSLGKNWGADIAVRNKLITTGAYKYMRHPIYSALLLMILGPVVLYTYLGGFILFLVFALGAWYKARQEEKFIAMTFPEYSEYKKKVKMFVPF